MQMKNEENYFCQKTINIEMILLLTVL